MRRLDGTFDHVFCISVLEHTADPLWCFDELWRVTRVGGMLSVTGDYAPRGLPARTVAAGRVLDHALLCRLVGPNEAAPDEPANILEGLGYFPQMWPTVVPIYFRFHKDAPAPPAHHGPAAASVAIGLPRPGDPRLRRHVALQCHRAARIYLSYDWLPEARSLFATAWRLDPRLACAFAWGLAARLQAPAPPRGPPRTPGACPGSRSPRMSPWRLRVAGLSLCLALVVLVGLFRYLHTLTVLLWKAPFIDFAHYYTYVTSKVVPIIGQ